MIVLEAPRQHRGGRSAGIARRAHHAAADDRSVRGGRPARRSPPTSRRGASKPTSSLIAVGQNVVSGPFEEFGKETTWGCFNADEHLAAEGHDHVFVGGDCQTGPSTVIRAIGGGRLLRATSTSSRLPSQKLPCDIEVPGTAAERPHAQGARGDNRSLRARAAVARFRWRRRTE